MRQLVRTFLLFFLLAGTASAQEGHPLKGSWIGEWSGNQVHGDFVLLVLDWDGKNVTGIINPGTDNMEIESAVLNTADWSVTLRAAGYEITGTIKELELPSRSIVGSWKHQNRSGNFEISRQ
jgi:hypothetical protein